MKRKHIWIVLSLLAVLATVAYLVYTFWPTLAEDRPTLMYFRADL